jgi:hypothetical protein
VFFSFPHIAIDSDGNVGTISRPNRPGDSSACGALIAVSGHNQQAHLVPATGVHARAGCSSGCCSLCPASFVCQISRASVLACTALDLCTCLLA